MYPRSSCAYALNLSEGFPFDQQVPTSAAARSFELGTLIPYWLLCPSLYILAVGGKKPTASNYMFSVRRPLIYAFKRGDVGFPHEKAQMDFSTFNHICLH